jgi:Smg protein
MKENVLDVLMYLFENYMDDETEMHPDRESLQIELQEAGFRKNEINRAFAWLEGLASDDKGADVSAPEARSMRVYSSEELVRLDMECRGFLMYLEQMGLLTVGQREIVLDRLMALGSDDIDVDQVKWVVLMVMFNQPGDESPQPWMEEIFFEERAAELH